MNVLIGLRIISKYFNEAEISIKCFDLDNTIERRQKNPWFSEVSVRKHQGRDWPARQVKKLVFYGATMCQDQNLGVGFKC